MAFEVREALVLSDTVSPGVEDEFYYGHRLAVTRDETGAAIYTYQPLTPDDFLDPEEGDHFVQGTLHEKDVDKAKSIFRHLHQDDPNVTVFSDLKMEWGIAGLSQPAPDVAVIENVQDPDRPRGTFDVRVEGTRPRFVLEIVSPRYREQDLKKKVDIYARAGVEEYMIVDSGLRGESEEIAYAVLGYRLQGKEYVEIRPDERGWIFSAVNNVWIGVSEGRDGFFVVDGLTGQAVLSNSERAQAEAVARTEAERRAQAEATARAEAERRAQTLESELARLREELARAGHRRT